METWPIGVFASLDAGLGVKWDVIKELGLPTIQLHAPHAEKRNVETAQQLKKQLDEMNVVCTAVFGGFEGESYADIPTVARTIGLVPQETRQGRLAEMRDIADFTKALGCDTVALHLGFIPEDPADPQYAEVVAATVELCNHCEGNDQYLHLETGQESAEGLMEFIAKVGSERLKINFDPANMILYGTGEPIEALRKVAPHVRSVHCKDATWSDKPGETWGAEVPLGKGDVDIKAYLATLKEIGYDGALTIEREIPEEPERQKSEIGAAVDLLNGLKQALLG